MSTTSTLRLIRPGGSARDVHQSYSGLLPGRLWDTLSLWLARSTQRAALGALVEDAHLLNDIGLTREQAMGEAHKSFWRGQTCLRRTPSF